MYLALRTWLDIAYAIDRLAQFTQELKPKHWTAIKQVFYYLKGTQNNTLRARLEKSFDHENMSSSFPVLATDFEYLDCVLNYMSSDQMIR